MRDIDEMGKEFVLDDLKNHIIRVCSSMSIFLNFDNKRGIKTNQHCVNLRNSAVCELSLARVWHVLLEGE